MTPRRSETPPKIIDRGIFIQNIKCHHIFIILCPRKNPKIQESCKSKAIRRTGAKGQLKNARRNKKRLGFNLTPPSLCFFGFSNGLSIYQIPKFTGIRLRKGRSSPSGPFALAASGWSQVPPPCRRGATRSSYAWIKTLFEVSAHRTSQLK